MSYNFRFNALLPYVDEIVEGVVLTIQLSVGTMSTGLAIGLLVALGSQSPIAAVRAPIRA